MSELCDRIEGLDWEGLLAGVDEHGYAVTPQVVSSGTRHTLGIIFHDAE